MDDNNKSNSFVFSGTVKDTLKPKVYATEKGDFYFQQILIENYEGGYRHEICFEVYGKDKIEKFDLHTGEEVTVNFNLISRFFNNKWFTTARIWRCVKQKKYNDGVMPMKEAMSVNPPAASSNSNRGEDDLPF